MISLRARFTRAILAIVPPLALTAGIPFANRDRPHVAGLPFLLFWIVLWVVLTPLFLLAIYRIEGRGK